jgi:hypothetical protein
MKNGQSYRKFHFHFENRTPRKSQRWVVPAQKQITPRFIIDIRLDIQISNRYVAIKRAKFIKHARQRINSPKSPEAAHFFASRFRFSVRAKDFEVVVRRSLLVPLLLIGCAYLSANHSLYLSLSLRFVTHTHTHFFSMERRPKSLQKTPFDF